MTIGIYEAVFHASWKIDDLRIDDDKYIAAVRGDIDAQNYVILRYKGRLRRKYPKQFSQLPRIYWNDKNFDMKRIGETPFDMNRITETSSAVSSPTKRIIQIENAMTDCDCSCNWCDVGNHCGFSRRKCNA